MTDFIIELHIPTEQYGFILIKMPEATPEDVRITYDRYTAAFKAQPANGLPDKEYNGFIDRMLLGENNYPDVFAKMSPQQSEHVQVIKRSLARIKSRNQA